MLNKYFELKTKIQKKENIQKLEQDKLFNQYFSIFFLILSLVMVVFFKYAISEMDTLQNYSLNYISELPRFFQTFSYELGKLPANPNYSEFYEAFRFSDVDHLDSSFLDKVSNLNLSVLAINFISSGFFLGAMFFATTKYESIKGKNTNAIDLIFIIYWLSALFFTIHAFISSIANKNIYSELILYATDNSYDIKNFFSYVFMFFGVYCLINLIYSKSYLFDHKKNEKLKAEIQVLNEDKIKEEEKIMENTTLLNEIADSMKNGLFDEKESLMIDAIFDKIEAKDKKQKELNDRHDRYKKIITNDVLVPNEPIIKND